MRIPRRFLPPVHLLAALEAAARHGSFTEAAKELDLTQSAVSRQISKLEKQIGFELFVRDHQTVRLTEAGAKYAAEIRSALRHIAAASMGLRANPQAATLNVATVPAFGNRWLVPRLGDFSARHPGVTINVFTRPEIFSFEDDPMDVAVHFGSSPWVNCHGVELMTEMMVPMAAPELLRRHHIATPAELLAIPLLVLTCLPDSWEEWLGLNRVSFGFIHGQLFDQMEACAAAAECGAGVALLPRLLFQRELDNGRLQSVFDSAVHSRLDYQVMWPVEKEDTPLRSLFVNWLRNLPLAS